MRCLKFVLIFIFVCFLSFADEVTLKSGEIIKGTIVYFDESIIKIKSDDDIEYSIKKKNIREINYTKNYSNKTSDEDEQESEDSDDTDDAKIKSKSKSNDFNSAMYDNYKSVLGAGFGFLIPGLVLTFVPLIFGTPPIATAILYDNALNHREFMIPFLWYIGLMGIGVILCGISIVCFAVAGNMFNKFVKSNNVSILSGFEDKNSYVAVRIRL